MYNLKSSIEKEKFGYFRSQLSSDAQNIGI